MRRPAWYGSVLGASALITGFMASRGSRRARAGDRWLAIVALVVIGGCLGGGKESSATAASGSSSDATTSSSTSQATTSTSSTATTTTDASSGTTGGTSTTTGPEICEAVETYGDETAGPPQDCDIWLQDCPPCQKCTAWGADGGSSWNANRCVPLDPNPKQVLEPCTVQGAYNSGLDDCDAGLLCWNVHEDDLGYCIAFCTGTIDEPECPDSIPCMNSADDVLPICVPSCDPLLQECPGEDLCLPYVDRWICVLDGSGPGMGADGDPCEFENSCDPGLLCASPDRFSDCQASGCCATICDLGQPNTCPLKDLGAECVPFYAMGEAPPGKGNVGFCGLP